jgi:hypothetical protein
MTATELNALAKEVHENAVKHGFYTPEPEIEATFDNFHRELSEAFDAYAKDKQPFEIYFDEQSNKKPDGIVVELADMVLRILDTSAAIGHKLEPFNILCTFGDSFTFTKFINAAHGLVRNWFDESNGAYVTRYLWPERIIHDIAAASKHFYPDVDFWAVVKAKHEYNKLRPWKHGKRC